MPPSTIHLKSSCGYMPLMESLNPALPFTLPWQLVPLQPRLVKMPQISRAKLNGSGASGFSIWIVALALRPRASAIKPTCPLPFGTNLPDESISPLAGSDREKRALAVRSRSMPSEDLASTRKCWETPSPAQTVTSCGTSLIETGAGVLFVADRAPTATSRLIRKLAITCDGAEPVLMASSLRPNPLDLLPRSARELRQPSEESLSRANWVRARRSPLDGTPGGPSPASR